MLLFLFLLSFLPTAHAGLFDCTSASWGDWGSWSTCPAGADGTDSTIVTIRSRTCTKSPAWCLTSISCDGEMSMTMVCGTTTTKLHYSTIVFGTTAVDETSTVAETTSTDAGTTTETTAGVTTTTDAKEDTTAATTTPADETSAKTTTASDSVTSAATTASDSETSAGSTTGGSETSAKATTASSAETSVKATTASESETSAGATTAESSQVTTTQSSAEETTAAVPTTKSSSDGGDTSPDVETTLDFTFASDAPGADTTLPPEQSTAPYDECAPPVTTVSTMGPGTLGTLYPGAGSGGSGALDPYTFATETPTPMPGVTRSPACKTTPITTTTIAFKTCTMISVSSTSPMVSTTTPMETSTTAAVSTTDASATSAGSTTAASASSTEASATSEAAVSTTEASATSAAAGSSTEASATSEAAGSSTEESATSDAAGSSSESPVASTDAQVASTDGSASSEAAGSSTEASVVSTDAAASSTEASVVSTDAAAASTDGAASSEAARSSTDAAVVSTDAASGSSTEASVVSTDAAASSEAAGLSTETAVVSTDAAASSEAAGSSTEASVVSTDAAASSESPEASTDAPSVSSESPIVSTEASEPSTTLVKATTTASSSWTTCNDCSQINVQLFDGVPYEDASSVLNRYSASGCYYVQFFCRPIVLGDTTAVSTILSGNTSYLSAPLSASLACRDKKWVLLGSSSPLAASVTSLGCVYAVTTTTTKKPTTIPGVDPTNPCMNCSNLVVSQSVYPEGVTYLDHTIGTCLSAVAHCVPINGGTQVSLIYNNQGTLASGSSVNRTFTCTKNSKWLDVTTNAIVSNISCIMPTTTTPSTTLVPSTVRDLPSTDGQVVTNDISKKPTTKATTPDVVAPEDETTPDGLSTTESMTTAEDIPSTEEHPVTVTQNEVVPTTTVTTTTPTTTTRTTTRTTTTVATTTSSCNNCAPLEPLAMTLTGTYNGMLVLWHYKQNGCMRVDISCQATQTSTDVTTLYYNPYGKVGSGVGEVETNLVCNNGAYSFNGTAVKTVSCLATTTAVVPATTLPPVTTPAPGADCSGCNRLPVVVLGSSSSYSNGNLKATTAYSSCMSLQLTCYGLASTDQVSLLYADSVMSTAKANTNLTLTCNTAGSWVTSSLQTIDSISCGYVPLALTTTTAPSACGACANMESAQALLQTGTYDGMIVLYNYVDSKTGCKKVDISCQGTTSSENSTLIFQPIGAISTGVGIHEISLNCSSDGSWRYGGTVVSGVSCVVSQAVGTVPVTSTTAIVPTTTTTLNLTIPLCSQCSRLTASAISSIDNSLMNGFTTMIFSTVNQCSVVQVTCSGLTTTERVTLLAATTSLVSGIGSVSFNFTCNSAASWMTSAGTIVDTVACGRYNLTASTILTTIPTTTTATTTTTTPTTPTTTTTATSQCSKCANLMAKAVQPSGSAYDGMIVLNHYTDNTGCRKVDVSCGPTLSTENATIIFGSTTVATGAATHTFTLTCNSNANWVYQSASVSTVSCVISPASGGVTVAPTTSTTKAASTGGQACSQCGRAPIVSVGTGSPYLNGFTTLVQSTNSAGCSLLYVKCQGTTTADGVALLNSGSPVASSFGSTSVNLTCNSQSQWVSTTGTVVTALACGHKTSAVATTIASTTASLGQCASCANMVAVTMATGSAYDGMVVMDHFINPNTMCRAVTVTCAPTLSTENATLYFGSSAVATGQSSHTLQLACNPSALWTYNSGVVSSVGCVISTGSSATSATTVTTSAPVTNPTNNLCSQCTQLSIQSVSTTSGFQNGFTTLTTTINSYGCSQVTMMCQGVTSSDAVSIVINGYYAQSGLGSVNYTDFACNSQGKWTSSSYGTVTSVVCQRNSASTSTTAATTTTTALNLCNACSDVRPFAMSTYTVNGVVTQMGDYYDGMIVINHYKDRTTQCRKASIDCMTTMDYEVAELFLNSNSINTGSGVGVNLQCSKDGSWVYDDEVYSSTSCLVANSTADFPSSKKRKKRQAGTGLTACQSCNTLPLTSLYSFYPYMNGFATISMDDSSTCMTATAMCEGISDTNAVAWIASGTILSSGVGAINMTFTCNSLSSWQTSSGSVFSSLSCGRQVATTTASPTTTVASQALNCPNLVAAPLTSSELASDETNGQLVIDHYVNTTILARVVTITCYGTSTTDNTTISFNGGSLTVSGTGQTSLTMTCSSSGQWLRNGMVVSTVACLVISPVGTTVPLTTAIPTTPTTSAGSLPSTNCARNVMLTIPSGYNAGYLSMNTISTETSLQVVMSCAAPTGISESLLLSSTGAILTTGTATTNLTLTCNSASQWVVTSTSGTGISVGTVITSIACVVAVSSTTQLATTVPASCRQCANLPAIGLQSYQLDANERNGQFVVDHVTTLTACRKVYLSCAGSSASENSTILFNGGAETMSTQGITATTLTCTSSGTWDWYGTTVGYASCKVADRALTTTAAPVATTTTAYVFPGDTGLACNTSSLINVLINGNAGAYLVLDTNIVNGGLSTSLSCAAPDNAGTAVLTNGDGTVLGQSSNGLMNMTLTCDSSSQWVITAISSSTSGTSASLGTVVSGLKCGEIAATTTTLATTTPTTTPTTTTPTTTTIATSTTASGACQKCTNMQAFALSSQLVSGAANGQLLLSHSVDPSTLCRVVVIKCRGDNVNQNATIFFNTDGSQTLSAMYGQVSTSIACASSNLWLRSSASITSIGCMITSVVGSSSTSAPLTTLAPSSTTQSSLGAAASCNTAFTTTVSASGYTSGFMTVDTTTSGTTMTAQVNCASPVSTQTAALLDSSSNVVSSGVSSTNLTLTCNSNSQWVTSSGTVITSLSCGTVATATTAAATTSAAGASCASAAWNAWGDWSTCTDTCGSCGTQQRFRSCNKPLDTCTCTGSAYDKAYCNLAVCKFPRDSCCTGFTPRSSNGTFMCLT